VGLSDWSTPVRATCPGMYYRSINKGRITQATNYRNKFCHTHLHLAPPFGVIPFEFCTRSLVSEN